MTRRAQSRVLVGRGQQLSQLDAALLRAQQGEPGAVLIRGEAGVGKSRLVKEVADRARAAGVRVLVGNCAALGGTSQPFLPLAEALRPLADDLGHDTPSELAGIVRPTAPAQRFALLLALLREAARSESVLLVIDDVHWADRSTLEFLAFLIRNVRDEQLLLIATVRDEAVDRQPGLRSWLVEAYGGGAEHLSLEPFGRGEHDEFLASALGGTVAPQLAEAVFARSAGNAFFAEELLAAVGSDADAPIPPTLSDTLRGRLEELSPPTQAVLRAVAASGLPVHPRLIAEVLQQPEEDVAEALREALRHRVLVSEADAVRFRHPLLREVAYEYLLPGEREALHMRYAAALAHAPVHDGGSAARAAEIAEHCWRARDSESALRSALRAAIEAEAVPAPAEACVHFERALELWDRVVDPGETVPLSRPEVLTRAAAAAESSGQPERAEALVGQALAFVDPSHEPLRAAILEERRGWYLDRQGRSAQSLEAYERAVRLLPAEPSASRARVLALAGYEFLRDERWQQSRQCCEEALADARAVGASLEEGLALVPLGHILVEAGQRDVGIGCLQRARELVRELGSPVEAIRPSINLAELLVRCGRFAEAARIALEGHADARAAGVELTYGMFALSNACSALIQLGEWTEVERLTTEALARPLTGLPAATMLTIRAELEIWQGRSEAAERHLVLARAAPAGELPIDWRYDVDVLDGELAILQRRPRAALEAAVATSELPGTDVGINHRVRLARVSIRALALSADLARVHRAADELERVRDEARELEERVRDALEDVGEAGPEEAASLALIAAERSRVEGVPQPGEWATAVEALEAWGPPHQIAYGRWRWAESLLAAHAARSEAAACLQPAHEAARRLGAAPLTAEIEALARRARIDLRAEPSSPPAPQPLTDELGLTTRELEVLEHLALGETNRQIAESLFISIKTAGVHVSNILRKLNATNRAEAAAIAHRSGLLEAENRNRAAALRP